MSSTTIVHPFRRGAARRTYFGYITEDFPRTDRFQNAISATCAVIAGLSIVVTTVLTVVDISLRTFFNLPLGWSVAFIETYLMTATAFFGMVTAYRSGAHVAVVSIFNRFPVRGQKMLLIIGYCIVAFGFCALFVGGTVAADFALQIGERPLPGSSELMIPGWVWMSFIPVSAVLGFVLVVIDLVREIATPWNTVSTDYDPGEAQ